MSKIIYDVIQRFEVENGVPRLVSTNIQVIEGGEDLMSLATSMLEKLGFYNKFEENRTSQYVGYRLKNPGKGAKRYQLVLAQRKEELCISIPQKILWKQVLKLGYWTLITDKNSGISVSEIGFCLYGVVWILPSKKEIFLASLFPQYWDILQHEEKTLGEIALNKCTYDQYEPSFIIPDSEIIPRNSFRIEDLSENSSYLILSEDRLFPYMWQVCITSNEVLEEFIGYFAKILMEQK
ncbi:hypothetical protein [Nostoc sp.]|uniref:hypothetical protein n=1 Tax=Nostoc sp. TaxID=1180 RepID=UPI002FF4C411